MLTPPELQALLLSLKVASVATVASVLPALLVAWVLEKSEWSGRAALDVMVGLPLVLPPVVTGYALLLAFSPRFMAGRAIEVVFGGTIIFTWFGAALAAAVVSFPLMVGQMRLSIAAIDPELERTARTLGATRFRSFVEIVLPLARNGIASGAVLAFARALGEFGATIMVAGNIAGRTRTLPLAIYTEAQTPGGETAALRLVAIAVALSIGAVLASRMLQTRGARVNGGRTA